MFQFEGLDFLDLNSLCIKYNHFFLATQARSCENLILRHITQQSNMAKKKFGEVSKISSYCVELTHAVYDNMVLFLGVILRQIS